MPNTQPEKLSNPLSLSDPLPAEYWHAAGSTGSNLRDLVLGISDGLVTVLSFVAGSTALLANTNLVLRTGFAEMFAGGVSMGLGAYLGSRSQRELYEKERQRESREVEEMPERERDEIRNIYARKGFSGADLEMIVARLSEDKTRWVDLMMGSTTPGALA
jgi:vacuolar iron transporter family protein